MDPILEPKHSPRPLPRAGFSRGIESGIWELRSGSWDLGAGIWGLGAGIWDLGTRGQPSTEANPQKLRRESQLLRGSMACTELESSSTSSSSSGGGAGGDCG